MGRIKKRIGMLREASDAEPKRTKRRKSDGGEESDTVATANGSGAGAALSDEESLGSDSAASSAEDAQRLL